MNEQSKTSPTSGVSSGAVNLGVSVYLTPNQAALVSRYIEGIYRVSLSSNTAEFQQWCVSALKPLVAFECCNWQLTQAFAERSSQSLVSHNQQAFCVLIEQQAESSGLLHSIEIVRNNRDRPFDRSERGLIELMTMHWAEAYRLNILAQYSPGEKWRQTPYAICNQQGDIIAAQTQFRQLLKQTLHWSEPRLPAKLGSSDAVRVVKPLVFESVPRGDVLLVHAIDLGRAFEGLTAKELEVCFYLREAVANDALASLLSVSIKTLEKHLGSIYQKLKVSGRSELIARLNNI